MRNRNSKNRETVEATRCKEYRKSVGDRKSIRDLNNQKQPSELGKDKEKTTNLYFDSL